MINFEIAESDKRKRAKKWGEANGFKGMEGGWIWVETKEPQYAKWGGWKKVCHGWGALYDRCSNQIERYLAKK